LDETGLRGVDFLQKPFSEDPLWQKIEKAMDAS
jgi:FixJ family two-component response regulator